MHFSSISASLARSLAAASFVTTAALGSAGCSSPASASSSTSSQSALTSSADDAGADATLTPCLTTFVGCVRAGTDDTTCHEALHECLRPPPRDDADGGDCDHDRGSGHDHGGPPPRGDHAGGDRPEPPDGPPPGDVDGGAPSGPHACFAALSDCAKGSDDAATCVASAVTCLEALPHHGHRGPPPSK